MMRFEHAKKIGRKFQNVVPTKVGGFSTMLKVLPQFLTNRAEREPTASLGPFRTDVSIYERLPASGLRVTWFGHSGMLLELDGARVLVDPVWDQRASPFSFMGPKRFFRATMRLTDLPRVDAVLISHDHFDHLGERTVRRLAELMPELKWVTSVGVGRILQKFGAEYVTELDWTDAVDVGSVRITSVPARHFSGRSLSNRNETLWASFVLKGPRHNLYYGADSGFWEGFAAVGEQYGPFDLTMLEIGAFNELWDSIHLGPDGAVRAFEAMGGGVLMPIHWGLFDLALHAWRQPIERMWELAVERGTKLFSPEPGVPTEFEGNEVRSDWWRAS